MAKLSVISGQPIPIVSLGDVVHQPKIKDIAAMGEEDYFFSLSVINQSDKDRFKENILQDKKDLTFDELRELEMELNFNYNTNYSIFQFFCSSSDNKTRNIIESLFYIIFPNLSSIQWTPRMGVIFNFQNKETKVLTEESFDELREIVYNIFTYKTNGDKEKDFNPVNGLAQQIADKIQKAKEMRAAQGPRRTEEDSFLADVCSILAASTNSTLLEIMELTYPQLMIQYERSTLLMNFTNQMRVSAFGGIKSEDLIDWTRSL